MSPRRRRAAEPASPAGASPPEKTRRTGVLHVLAAVGLLVLRRPMLVVTFLGVVLALGSGAGLEVLQQVWRGHWAPRGHSGVGLPFDRVDHVPRRHWEPRRGFMEEVVNARMPVILSEAPSDGWRAVREPLSPEWLVKNRGNRTLQNYYAQKGDGSFMYYFDHHPLHGHPGLDSSHLGHDGNTTVGEFYSGAGGRESLLYDDGDPVYRYYSAELSLDFPDLIGWAPHAQMRTSAAGSQLNVWLGSQGTVAHPHWDSAFNFFIQVTGKKHWTLLPPSATSHMYVYPRLHPRHPQSQVDWSAVDEARFPAYRAAPGVLEAVLEPGDVLLVPPYWWHRVEALTESTALNSWWDCPEADVLTEMFQGEVPRVEDAALQVHVMTAYIKAAGRAWLASSQGKLGGEGAGDARDLVQALLRERYHPVLGHTRPAGGWGGEKGSDWCELPEEAGRAGLEAQLGPGVDQVVGLLHLLPPGREGASLARHSLQSLFEQWALEVFPATEVYPYLDACFSS